MIRNMRHKGALVNREEGQMKRLSGTDKRTPHICLTGAPKKEIQTTEKTGENPRT